jgi:hypothetical protein
MIWKILVVVMILWVLLDTDNILLGRSVHFCALNCQIQLFWNPIFSGSKHTPMWTCTLGGLNKLGPIPEGPKRIRNSFFVIHFCLEKIKEKKSRMAVPFKNGILFHCVTLGSILFPHYGSKVKTAIFVLLDDCH